MYHANRSIWQYFAALIVLPVAISSCASERSSTQLRDDRAAERNSESTSTSGVEAACDNCYLGYSSDLARLIESSQLIVLGSYNGTSTAGTTVMSLAGPTLTPNPVFGAIPNTIPNVTYQIDVEQVLKGSAGSVVNVVMLGSLSHPISVPVGEEDAEYLYFLSDPDQDGKYSLLMGYTGRLILDSILDQVQVSLPTPEPLSFATGTSVADFILAVRTEVVAQTTATLTPMPTSTTDPYP